MRKVISRIAIVAVVIFIAYNLITFYTEPEMTSVAQMKTIEITYNFDGVVSRNEKIVTTSKSDSGWFEPGVSENEMVKSSKLLGVYYDGDIDNDTKLKLDEINRAIEEAYLTSEELDKLEAREERFEHEIEKKKNEMYELLLTRDMKRIKLLKQEISDLMSRRENGDENAGVTKTLEELQNEKREIENSVKLELEEIYSPCHGIFTTYIDGFENTLTAEAAANMTVDDFEAVKKSSQNTGKDTDGTNVCKIVDNSVWWLSMLADEDDVKNFKIGETLTVRIAGETDEIEAHVDYISPAKDGKYIITLSSYAWSDYIFENRFINVTVVKESYTGLEVPIKAIRVKDGKAGVYVKTDNVKKFRETEIIYKNDEIAIVKINTTAIKPNALLLYDEVVIN